MVPLVIEALLVFAAVANSSCEASVCMAVGPTDWAWRGLGWLTGAGMLALRLTFLLFVTGPGEADILTLVAFFVIAGKFSTSDEKLCLVSSFMSFAISEFISCWSALKGDILLLFLLFF